MSALWPIASAERSTSSPNWTRARPSGQPADSLAGEKAKERKRHEPSKAVNIVMIEDDEGHARLIEKNIRRAGISNPIHHFLDGTSALHFLYEDPEGPATNGPALILLDLNLPDMSGTDILAKIKGEGPAQARAGRGPDHHRRQGRDPALLRSGLQRLHHQAGQL
jgi:CheY-like chemotaxis protein